MTTPRRTRVDLHSHTARSDGVLEPVELHRQMRAAGMALVAITDHDTLAGVRELQAAGLGGDGTEAGPRVIPGVEINTLPGEGMLEGIPELRAEELHILGLGVDPEDGRLEAALDRQRRGRQERLLRTLDVLDDLGMPVREHLSMPGDGTWSLGRPHVARALIAGGWALSVDDAFERYLERGRPAYVPRVGMGPREAIGAIAAAGGLPALAHWPDAPRARALILRLMEWGLRGLEVHHRSFDEGTVEAMAAFAAELGLLPTGGSDYHGDDMDYATAVATTFVPDSVADGLLAALSR